MRLVEEEEKSNSSTISNSSNKEKQPSIVSERIRASVDLMPSESEVNKERQTISDNIRTSQLISDIKKLSSGQNNSPYVEISRTEGGIIENDRRFAASLLDNIRRAAKSGRLAFTAPQQTKRYGMPFDNCELSNQCVDGAKCARKAGISAFFI